MSVAAFSGTEQATLELRGTLDLAEARSLVGRGLEIDCCAERVPVDLFAFRMRGLRARGVPGLKFDYSEILWRVGVLFGGEPAWLNLVCDIDRRAVRMLGALFVRYPVRSAVLGVNTDRVTAEDGAGRRLALQLSPAEGAPVLGTSRRMLVRSRGRVFEIPWETTAAPSRSRVTVALRARDLADATLGAVSWDGHGVLSSGRRHGCGIARVPRERSA